MNLSSVVGLILTSPGLFLVVWGFVHSRRRWPPTRTQTISYLHEQSRLRNYSLAHGDPQRYRFLGSFGFRFQ